MVFTSSTDWRHATARSMVFTFTAADSNVVRRVSQHDKLQHASARSERIVPALCSCSEPRHRRSAICKTFVLLLPLLLHSVQSVHRPMTRTLCTTQCYSSTTLYDKVLLQYYSVLQSTTPVLLCTTKYYSSTTLYYKVLLQYYSVLHSTTQVLLCTTQCYSSTTLYDKATKY